MTTSPEEVDQSVSALRENIQRKGKNSYYYAHETKVDGPVWDGKEEPRLLKTVSVDSSSSSQIKTIPLESFSWLDDSTTVKIYVDFENAESVDDASITLESGPDFVKLEVSSDDAIRVLHIAPLSSSIESASFKKKKTKFIVTLNKKIESAWSQLRKVV